MVLLMKRVLTLFILSLLVTLHVAAQESMTRKKYVNLSFSNLKMKEDGYPSLKSNYGAAFTVGRTFFVHKNPIANMIRFGIDATWFDINYTNYDVEYRYRYEQEYESEKSSFHQVEIGMQVGPSITVNPVSKLNVHAYFRYAPSFSGLYNGDTFGGGYASYFVGGGAVSYGVIGLGLESRFGNCKYKTFGGDEEEEFDSENGSNASKRKFSGMRVYLSFRF